MHFTSKTIEEFFFELTENRKKIIQRLRQTILDNLPKSFRDELNNGIPCYVVSHSIFPDGYQSNRKEPLSFICFGYIKNYMSFYHMGPKSDKYLKEWFAKEYLKHSSIYPDMD